MPAEAAIYAKQKVYDLNDSMVQARKLAARITFIP